MTPYAFSSNFKLPFGNPYPITGKVLPNEHCYTVPSHLKNILNQLVPIDQQLFSLVLLKKIEQHLQKSYLYSLNSTGNGEEPLLDLITGKQGWCVHFATAMTLLARHHGFPARVVSGLCLQKPMPHPIQTTARLSHSHAWAEVYLEPMGWTIWDATPEDGILNPSTSSTLLKTESEHPIISLFKRFTRKVNNRQPDHHLHLSILLFIGFLLGLYSLYQFLQKKASHHSVQLTFNKKPLFDVTETKGLWQRLNEQLADPLKIKPTESIIQHIERIKLSYPDVGFVELSHMHNATLWGNRTLSNQECDWIESEIAKIKKLTAQNSQKLLHKI
jgi:hypothetical protein